jgi:hypothetical protein
LYVSGYGRYQGLVTCNEALVSLNCVYFRDLMYSYYILKRDLISWDLISWRQKFLTLRKAYISRVAKSWLSR